jgi:hypothetical protein
VNHWYAECIPCKWQGAHDTQDAAISAAEEHVFSAHSELFRLASDVRSRKMVEQRIGHVQFRSEDALSTVVPPFAVQPVVVETSEPENPALASPAAPAEE